MTVGYLASDMTVNEYSGQIISKKKGGISKEKELIKKGLEYKEKHMKQAELRRIEEAKQSCTFKPQLKARYQSQKNTERAEIHKSNPDKIYQELYVVKEKHADVRTEDIEYERNKDQLSFKPNLA
jgi:hypothetical protein